MLWLSTQISFTVLKLLPVIIVPIRIKTQRKMFPASVPKWSRIFPWQMVNIIPNTCACRTSEHARGGNKAGVRMCRRKFILHCLGWLTFSVHPVNNSDLMIFTVILGMNLHVAVLYLCWTVEESRWRSLWLWVRQLDCKLKTQRQVTRHEEPERRQTET